MKQQLSEIHKALEAHKVAHAAYCKAHDALHEVLERCGKGIAHKASGDSTVMGHFGQIVKARKLHADAYELHKVAHDATHAVIRKSLQAISDRTGTPFAYVNPNAAIPGSRDTDLSSPGEISDFPDRLGSGTQKSFTARDAERLLKHFGSNFGRQSPTSG